MGDSARVDVWLKNALVLCAFGFLSQVSIAAAADPQVALAWAGQDEDRTGSGQVKPDGGKDAHFRVTLTLPSTMEVRSLGIFSATSEGTPAGGQVWHSANGGYWLAAVFRNGNALHQTYVASLGQFSGEVILDVYCSDSGWFKPKNFFLVEVELGSGQKLRALTQISDQPPAVQPSAPPPSSGVPGLTPAIEVAILAYGKDESDGSDVGWNSLYPHPSFDDDPNRRGLPNAKWTGDHWWQGNNLCLSIKNLDAPWPPAHNLAIGYTVTLGGGRFADGAQTKTFVLYRYNGIPPVKEFVECHPVTAWKR